MQKTSRRRCHVSYERIYNNIFCISLITHLNLPFVPLSPWITQQNPTKSHVKSNQIPVNPTMKSHHISSEIPWNLGAPAPFPYAPWCWNIYLHLPQKWLSFVGKYSTTMVRIRVFEQPWNQWPFQKPKLELPTIYKAYFLSLNFREYLQKILPYMVQYLHFRILKFPLMKRWRRCAAPFHGKQRGLRLRQQHGDVVSPGAQRCQPPGASDWSKNIMI